MDFTHKGQKYTILRHPKSSNKSLRPWSAADEMAMEYLDHQAADLSGIALYNDRFGFLSTVLHRQQPVVVVDYKSQERAILQNMERNNIATTPLFTSPLAQMEAPLSTALIKVPKSMDLFALYLQQISAHLAPEGSVIAAFMTRHFSKSMVDVAETYFEDVEQTKAAKKARLMILKKPKKGTSDALINEVKFNADHTLKQYQGVFSASHIDYATQFLLDNMLVPEDGKMTLDLACGNGVLAYALRQRFPEMELHLLDDMWLAVESARLNLTGEHSYFHWNESLEEFESGFFDFIVSNPPFHFEHENNIEVSLELFRQAKRCLRAGGHFQLVANRHLNYKTHLDKLFATVTVVAENEKFIVYDCRK